jgi:nitrogen regulatory protein PII
VKIVVAIIKPWVMDDVRDAMEKVDADSFTYGEVRGIGHHKGDSDVYRGVEYTPSFVPMIELKVIVEDDDVDEVVGAIRESAKESGEGDGLIWVYDLDRVVSISGSNENA